MLEINNYTDSILKHINYHIKDSLLILGSNGAGKSSLAKVLCGITPSDSIKVNILKLGTGALAITSDKSQEQYSINLQTLSSQERAKIINYIPSKLDIFDEYISLKDYLSLSKIDFNINIDNAIDTLGLNNLKDRPCINLSSGESQLTLVASAIIHNAKITIFDEPTANLDPQKTSQIYKILSDKKIIKTKIVITHDLNLAYRLGFDVIYLKDGKIIFQGTNREFFKKNNIKQIFDNRVKKIKDFWVVNI
jgi:iron complex transport system ATP-binding protein